MMTLDCLMRRPKFVATLLACVVLFSQWIQGQGKTIENHLEDSHKPGLKGLVFQDHPKQIFQTQTLVSSTQVPEFIMLGALFLGDELPRANTEFNDPSLDRPLEMSTEETVLTNSEEPDSNQVQTTARHEEESTPLPFNDGTSLPEENEESSTNHLSEAIAISTEIPIKSTSPPGSSRPLETSDEEVASGDNLEGNLKDFKTTNEQQDISKEESLSTTRITLIFQEGATPTTLADDAEENAPSSLEDTTPTILLPDSEAGLNDISESPDFVQGGSKKPDFSQSPEKEDVDDQVFGETEEILEDSTERVTAGTDQVFPPNIQPQFPDEGQVTTTFPSRPKLPETDEEICASIQRMQGDPIFVPYKPYYTANPCTVYCRNHDWSILIRQHRPELSHCQDGIKLCVRSACRAPAEPWKTELCKRLHPDWDAIAFLTERRCEILCQRADQPEGQGLRLPNGTPCGLTIGRIPRKCVRGVCRISISSIF